MRAACTAIDSWAKAATPAALAEQAHAACQLLCGCSRLALDLQLQTLAVKQLCRSIAKQLAFGLAALPPDGSSASAAEAGPGRLAAMLTSQARAVCWAVALVRQNNTSQLATQLPPAAVVTWLRVILPVLSRLDDSSASGEPAASSCAGSMQLAVLRTACPAAAGWLCVYWTLSAASPPSDADASVTSSLCCAGEAVCYVAEAVTALAALSHPTGFSSVLAKDRRLCDSLVEVLLSQLHQAAQAEHTPAGVDWRSAVKLFQAALVPEVRPALQQQLEGSSGEVVLVSVAQLVLHAPLNVGSYAYDLTNRHEALDERAMAAMLATVCSAKLRTGEAISKQAVQLLVQLPPKLGPVLRLAVEAAAMDAQPLEELCNAWVGILNALLVSCSQQAAEAWQARQQAAGATPPAGQHAASSSTVRPRRKQSSRCH